MNFWLSLSLLAFVFTGLALAFIPQHEYLHCIWSWSIQEASGDCTLVYHEPGNSTHHDVAHAEVGDSGTSKWEHRVIYSFQLTFAATCLAPFAYGMAVRK